MVFILRRYVLSAAVLFRPIRDTVSAGRAYTLQSGGCTYPKRWTSFWVGCTFCQPAVRTGPVGQEEEQEKHQYVNPLTA